MLRLSVLLGLAMFVTLALAGEDRGQLRPGLAKAVEEGRDIVVVERKVAPDVVTATPVLVTETVAPAPVVVEVAYVAPAPAPAPERKVIPEPVFTLSALPTIGSDKVDLPEAAVQAAPAGDPSVWYVTGTSVNVRQGPSTDTTVMAKLTAGEAVTVVAMDGGDWAQILIEGDGVAGYVATRFLAPSAP